MPIKSFRTSFAACLLILFFSLLANVPLYAQSISGCVPNTSPAGNTVTVTITGVGVDFNSGTPIVDMKPGVGPSIYATTFIPTSPTTLDATFNIPSSATLGDYSMRIGSIIPNYIPSVFTVIGSGTTGTISGKVYHDVNENCNQESPDPDLSGFVVHLSPGDYYAMTNPGGDYEAYVPPGTYDIEALPPSHYSVLCPSAPISATLANVGSASSGNDFAMDVDSVTDGGISCASGEFRPGFNTTITVQARNVGILPITGEAQLVLDTNLTFVSASPSGTISGDTVKWSLSPALQAGEVRNYSVMVTLPVSVPLGTVISNQSWILPDNQDYFFENNNFACNGVVIGSYDPNDKTVWDQDMNLADPGIDLNDSVLIYRIRFQNTGTASAINVFIRDTLDSQLDPGSLEVLGTSHLPFSMNISGQGAVEWRFPDIDLPDSTSNEPESHGFVLFRVNIKEGFSTGMSISNQAHIYFDFNAPVATNEVSTSILLSVEEVDLALPIKVYPNPASEEIHVEMERPGTSPLQFKLYNAQGVLVRELQVSAKGGHRFDVPLEGLGTGVYFLETVMDSKRAVHKIAITR